MIISGLQKMTLLDFPGKVACTVFTQGCNFRCPFCHNSGLLGGDAPEQIPTEELLAFLKKRAGLLDGVCVTGGEPTLQKDLPEFLAQIKAMGYSVKLDTNGSHPDMLRKIAESGSVDYVAMDIKNCKARYGDTVGMPQMDLSRVEESMAYLLSGAVDYEFRTTVMAELHDPDSFAEIGTWLRTLDPVRKARRYFIQPYVERDSVLVHGWSTPDGENLHRMAEKIAPFVQEVHIRNLDE